ncbi:hypothetical protein [Mucilaginibacter sp. RCC_168]|uniref:hypothetical protein n=1 Tax=Mucilaginibacter sp. RCC_168 TaxID=3239221 RepID=UPI003526AA9B
MNLLRRALGRARASYFFSQKCNQKGLQQKGFFALKPLPANRTEPRAAIILPRFAALTPTSAKTCYALSITHTHHRSACFRPKLIRCEKAFSFNLGMVSIDT